MKKNIFFTIFLLFAYNSYGQTDAFPIIGYDKMVWGTNINDFFQLYPNVKEVYSDNSSIEVRNFKQTNAGKGIEIINFLFFKNQLYSVIVDYGDKDDNAVGIILEKIVPAFGKFENNEYTEKSVGNEILITAGFVCYYSNNLRVNVRAFEWHNARNITVGHKLVLYYANPLVEKEIDELDRQRKTGEPDL